MNKIFTLFFAALSLAGCSNKQQAQILALQLQNHRLSEQISNLRVQLAGLSSSQAALSRQVDSNAFNITQLTLLQLRANTDRLNDLSRQQ